MIKLICLPEHEAQLREKLKPFDALDLTLVEKGVDYDSIGILFQMEDLAELAANHQAFLLANHGPVVCGESLQEAANNMEELEETARLIFILSDRPIRYLTADEIAELRS